MTTNGRTGRRGMTGRERDEVRRIVLGEIAEANGGAFPRSLPEWGRACRRFGLRIVVSPHVTEPHVRLNHFLSRGRVYLPETDDYSLLHVWLVHEVCEAVQAWEGRGMVVYPPGWGDHHDLALIADGRG